MITRRSALLAAAAAATLDAVPGFAQRHPAAHGHAAGHAGKADADQPPSSPANTPIGPVDTAAKWAFIQDFTTGAQLLDKQADDEMTPSSMTKLMTLYIVYSRLKAGRMKLDDMLPVSEKAWRMGGSKMFVQINSQVRVEDLIRGIEVDSGNDACIVLAEAISGSEQQFADLMNETAKKLGLTHSQFKNSTGWPEDGHYMSCRDIATLASDIIRQFPEYYHYASEKTFKFSNIEQQNRNPLVQRGTADGLKTGHTEAGGYGLVASSLRGGRRVVLVLNGMSSMHERSEESERLMDWAFTNFEDVTLFAAGDVVEHASVWLGVARTVPLVGAGNLVVTMPRNWRKTAKIAVAFDAPVRAPVVRGTVIGKLSVSGEGVPDMQVPLLAGADVPRLGLPGRAVAVLAHYVTGS
ncbi:MAG TPA: D-alanyl-D-alanine carboxypeptidase family protein [Acetobacteraceae bacterium]|nr:D-alanyl-D-alanine carboxypeptidase family protein [Acetobacteraceae bacterium]